MAEPKATGAGRGSKAGKRTAKQRAAVRTKPGGRSGEVRPPAPAQQRCSAKTARDTRCKKFRYEHNGELLEVCLAHAPKEVQRQAGFGGAQPGSGRPRVPRPTEVIRERLERRLDELLDEIERIALEGTKTVVVPGTREQPGWTEQVDDLELRRRAIENILDRLAGKPTATHLLGGAPDEEPVKVDVPDTTERAAEVAAILKDAGAL